MESQQGPRWWQMGADGSAGRLRSQGFGWRADVRTDGPDGPDERALVGAAQLFGSENEVSFVLDRSSRRAVARIVNRETGELVAQIPSESVLQMALDT